MWLLKKLFGWMKKKKRIKSQFFTEPRSFSFIEKHDIKKWKNMHVLNWVERLRYSKEHEELIKEVLEREGIDGNDLLTMTFSDIDVLLESLEPNIFREKFWISLNAVKASRKFDGKWANVFHKLFRVGNQENLEYLEEYANILSDKRRFYDRYFSFFVDYFQAKEMELQISNHEKSKDKIRDKKQIKKIDTQIKALEKQCKALEERYSAKYEEISGKKFWDGNYGSMCGIRRTKIKLLPCKIIISEIFDDKETIKKKLRDFLSPLVSLMPKYKESTKFGMFHTAVIIGPWYLEWNYTELVVPKRSFGSQKALISYDMPVLLNINYDDLKELVHKIVEIVYFWNTHVFYGQARKPLEYKGNCQDFIDDIFQSINISADVLFQGMFGNFIKQMRNKGRAQLEFFPSDEFRNDLDIPWKKKLFETHRELDIFFREVMHKVADIKEKYMEEFYMLKSFDRAFWLRHFRDQENESFKPLPIDYTQPEHLRGCPFKDPRETMSYV